MTFAERLTIPALTATGVRHGFFTRRGGVSEEAPEFVRLAGGYDAACDGFVEQFAGYVWHWTL